MKDLLRKIVVNAEDVIIEGGRPAGGSYRLAVAAAILKNPWAGRGFVEDLKPEIMRIAPALGEMLVPRLLGLLDSGDKVEAYGKAGVVGTAGEIEHASALIHTLHFGNQLREAVSGKSFLPFTNKRVGPGASIDIPMKHISEEGRRSHFITATFQVADAPAADEIVVALGVSTGGRPHHRIGDRYEDMREMGVDQTGKVLA
jgi:hypothetical protein